MALPPSTNRSQKLSGPVTFPGKRQPIPTTATGSAVVVREARENSSDRAARC
ncbi:hypothetical protein DL240490_01931 [Mycobacterium marinum]|nr:hypothetical protein DL240490_01931 [Mycobacterium marinum]